VNPDVDVALLQATKGEDFSLNGRDFLAKVVDVYDGDTIRVVFRLGELVQYRARMSGYDSPEMRPPKTQANRDAEVAAARAAKAALIEKLGDHIVFIECGLFDKYGRLLVTVYTRAGPELTERGENVNTWMIAQGYGTPYDGGTKKPFGAE
jgi:endonuclease YncB( thermonuclease family)